MKIQNLALLASSILFFACTNSPSRVSFQKKGAASESPTNLVRAEAANRLYLGDMTESLEDEIPAETPVDPSVENDRKAARLQAMAEKLIETLDADASATLSEEEFVSLAATKGLSAKKQAKVEGKLQAEFVKFADEEGQLDETALIDLLKAQGNRIGKFRTKNHKGKQDERLDQSVAEILATFDANGDGVLDETELATLLSELGIQTADEGVDEGEGEEGDDGVNEGEEGDDGVIDEGEGKGEGEGEGEEGDDGVNEGEEGDDGVNEGEEGDDGVNEGEEGDDGVNEGEEGDDGVDEGEGDDGVDEEEEGEDDDCPEQNGGKKKKGRS